MISLHPYDNNRVRYYIMQCANSNPASTGPSLLAVRAKPSANEVMRGGENEILHRCYCILNEVPKGVISNHITLTNAAGRFT